MYKNTPTGSEKFHKSGFTLIEMLIVVAIVGILSSVVLVGLGPVQRRGRDARRISDIRQVQTGLELYYGKYGEYPDAADWEGLRQTLMNASIGVSNVPDDPNGSYEYVTDGTSYILGARLDDGENPALKSDIDEAPIWTAGFDCSDSENKYCVAL